MVEVKGKAEEAKGKAQAALDKAMATKKNIERSNNDLRDLIKQIRDFLTREWDLLQTLKTCCGCVCLQAAYVPSAKHPSPSTYPESGPRAVT